MYHGSSRADATVGDVTIGDVTIRDVTIGDVTVGDVMGTVGHVPRPRAAQTSLIPDLTNPRHH